jgi:hypothetical protein
LKEDVLYFQTQFSEMALQVDEFLPVYIAELHEKSILC